MTKLTLLILAVLALAAPAGAQGLVATSSVGGVLADGQTGHPQRALAMAAFGGPSLHPSKTVAPDRLALAQRPQIQPKDEWLREDGFRIRVNRIAYTARF